MICKYDAFTFKNEFENVSKSFPLLNRIFFIFNYFKSNFDLSRYTSLITLLVFYLRQVFIAYNFNVLKAIGIQKSDFQVQSIF